jgi:methionine salvage enolase-phosphatase E1
MVLHCLPWPFLCGFTRGMKEGEYIEVNGHLVPQGYRSLNLTNPVYEVHAKQIRRLEIPVDGVVEKYNG